MANGTENNAEWRGRRWAIAGVVGAQGFTGLSIQVSEIADDGSRIVLSRNEASRVGAVERIWRGGFTNRTAEPCRDLAVEIRFLDHDGATAGTAAVPYASAATAWAPPARLL